MTRASLLSSTSIVKVPEPKRPLMLFGARAWAYVEKLQWRMLADMKARQAGRGESE